MPLTTLPEKEDASIGREKSQIGATPNLDNYVPVEEWERIKTYLIDVCDEAGVHSGETGSLNARLEAVEDLFGIPTTQDAGATYVLSEADRGRFILLTHATPTLSITSAVPDGFWCLVMGTQGVVILDGSTLTGGVIADDGLYEDDPVQTAGAGGIVSLHMISIPAFPEPPVLYAKVWGELLRRDDYASQIGALGAAADSFTLATLNTAITDANLDAAGTARPPTNHASNHFAGAGDEIEPGDINALPEDTVIEDSAATSRTLSASDRNKLIRFTAGAGCEVTIPHTVAAGISFALLQGAGAGPITVIGSGGMTIVTLADYDAESAGEHALIVATVIVTGASGVTKLYGELALA